MRCASVLRNYKRAAASSFEIWSETMIRYTIASLPILWLAACAQPSSEMESESTDSQPSEIARTAAALPTLALHDSLLTLDAHLDTPAMFHNGDYDFSQNGSFDVDGTSVDLPRLRNGGLDGGFDRKSVV